MPLFLEIPQIEGYTSTLKPILRVNEEAAFDSGLIREINVNGVRFMKMPMVTDLRGILSYGEYDKQLPFVPRRYFVVADVPAKMCEVSMRAVNCTNC